MSRKHIFQPVNSSGTLCGVLVNGNMCGAGPDWHDHVKAYSMLDEGGPMPVSPDNEPLIKIHYETPYGGARRIMLKQAGRSVESLLEDVNNDEWLHGVTDEGLEFAVLTKYVVGFTDHTLEHELEVDEHMRTLGIDDA